MLYAVFNSFSLKPNLNFGSRLVFTLVFMFSSETRFKSVELVEYVQIATFSNGLLCIFDNAYCLSSKPASFNAFQISCFFKDLFCYFFISHGWFLCNGYHPQFCRFHQARFNGIAQSLSFRLISWWLPSRSLEILWASSWSSFYFEPFLYSVSLI